MTISSKQQTLNKLIKQIETSLDQEAVILASIEAAQLLSEDYQYVEAMLILDQVLPFFNNQIEHPSYDIILSLLIDNAIKANLQQETLNYIQLRKDALPILDEHKHILDLINYKKAFNIPYFNHIDDLIRLNVDKKIIANLVFEKLLSNKNNYEAAIEDIELLTIYKDDTLAEAIKAINYYLLYNHNKDELKALTQTDNSIYARYYELLMLMDENKYKQAQILEVEHETEFINLPLDMQHHLYKRIINFYQDDIRSVELYEKKLNKVKKLMETKKDVSVEPALKIPKKKQKDIEKEELVVEDVKPKQTSISHDEVLFHIDKYMLSIIGLSRNLPFHEYVRQMCIHMERFFDFSDILFNFNYAVYHYKKERLYEKQIPPQTLDSTLLGISAQSYRDIVEYTKNLKYDYDILTEKPLSQTNVKNVYTYALEDKSSICFYQRQDKDLIYDDLTFKLLANFISYEIRTYQQLDKLTTEHKQNLDLFDANLIALSHGLEPMVGNKVFQTLFQTKSLTFQELLLKIIPADRIKYKELMESLLRKEITHFDIKVATTDKTLQIKHVLNGVVYGYYIDITQIEETHQTLMEKAKTTPLNTYTMFAFEERFNTYINQKTTFILVELENLDDLISLYGKDEGKAYFTEFSTFLSKYGRVYMFDGNSVLLTFDFNDIRAVENKINAIYKDVLLLETKKPFQLAMGVIRYPINTKEKSMDKLFEYLDVALDKARRSYKKFEHFNYEDYQETVFETEIIRQIDRLIESETLEITFTQIVNQTSNKVYAYDIGLFSDALKINPNYYHLVAKKKNQLEALERYQLKQTFKALETMFKATNRYIKLSIDISAETLRTRDFIPFLIGLYKTHQIPYHVLDIIVLMKTGYISDYEKTKELSNLGIRVGTDNLSYLKEPQTKVFHYKEKPGDVNEKFLSFLKHLKDFSDEAGIDFIIYHVDRAKDKLLLKSKGFSFIRGDTVDKTFKYNQIINLIKGVTNSE